MNAQSEATPMIHGHKRDPFDFSEDLRARIIRLGRTYSDENIKSLFLYGLITSLEPNLRRYW